MDTLGLVLAVLVTRADVSDAQGARWLLGELEGFRKKLRRIWEDGGYRGELMQCLRRRLNREHDEYLFTSQNFIYIAMIRLMTQKLP